MKSKIIVAAGVLIILLLTIGAVVIQGQRMKALGVDLDRVTTERDAALAANGEQARQKELAEQAARAHQVALQQLRADYERRLSHAQKIPDDGCLDRALPPDVLRLLTEGNPGAGETFCPAGP